MDFRPAPKSESGGQAGIALFMVVSAMAILSVLVTEFTYVAQVGQRMAYDGLDQLQAHYLAKSGLKLSLLRLKAYQNLKALTTSNGSSSGGGGSNPLAGAIPRQILEQIWSFPFAYPIPTELPGLSVSAKDEIKKFQSESGLQGSFTAAIESESSRYNLNQLLAAFTPPTPTPQASSSPSPTPPPSPTPSSSPGPAPSFDPEQARQALEDYMGQILQQKFDSDPDFANEYRDLKLQDLTQAIICWADRDCNPQTITGREPIKPKGAPFFSLTELHMINHMDDQLYDLFAPKMTVASTPGVNVNTIQKEALHALLPLLTDDEITEFYKFRDDPDGDNAFKSETDFFKYLQDKIAAYKGDANKIQEIKNDFAKKGIRIVTDETVFKITVKAQVNQSSRLLEAWVTLIPFKNNSSSPTSPASPTAPGPTPSALPTPNANRPDYLPATDSGLKITFMRIL